MTDDSKGKQFDVAQSLTQEDIPNTLLTDTQVSIPVSGSQRETSNSEEEKDGMP